MFLSKKAHVVIVKGKNACAIYDFGKKRMFRVNKDAADLLSMFDGKKRYDDLVNDFPEAESFIKFCISEELAITTEKPVEVQPTDINNYMESDVPTQNITIEITSYCNHRCKHCFVGDGLNKHSLDFDTVIKTLDELREHNEIGLTFSGGEPTIHPQFKEIISYALKLGFKITVLTNGLNADDETINLLSHPHVTVSIPILGWQESHDEMTSVLGSFNRVINNIKLYKERNANLRITTVISNLNYKDMPKMEQFCSEIGVTNFEVSPLFPIGWALKNWAELCKDMEQYDLMVSQCGGNEQHEYNKSYQDIPEKLFSCCDCGTKIINILSDGAITPCLMLREKTFELGSIYNESITDIISSEHPGRLRVKSLMSYINLPTCSSCEAMYICRGGGCRGMNYFLVGDICKKNPLYDRCYYSEIECSEHLRNYGEEK